MSAPAYAVVQPSTTRATAPAARTSPPACSRLTTERPVARIGALTSPAAQRPMTTRATVCPIASDRSPAASPTWPSPTNSRPKLAPASSPSRKPARRPAPATVPPPVCETSQIAGRAIVIPSQDDVHLAAAEAAVEEDSPDPLPTPEAAPQARSAPIGSPGAVAARTVSARALTTWASRAFTQADAPGQQPAEEVGHAIGHGGTEGQDDSGHLHLPCGSR